MVIESFIIAKKKSFEFPYKIFEQPPKMAPVSQNPRKHKFHACENGTSVSAEIVKGSNTNQLTNISYLIFLLKVHINFWNTMQKSCDVLLPSVIVCKFK